MSRFKLNFFLVVILCGMVMLVGCKNEMACGSQEGPL